MPDRPIRRATELAAPRSSRAMANRSAAWPVAQPQPPASAKTARQRVTSALVTATRSHIAPLRARVTSRGLAGAAPASLAIAVASLILTALVQVPSALQADATRWFEYRGDDLYAGELWRLVTSGLLAQSWLQYLWTLFIAVVVFAVLEARVGPGRMLACVAASHVLPTVAVALLAPLLGRPDVLNEVDYGTSCLVVGAVAALAWLGRSAVLAAFIVVGLAADVMLSAPVTAIEHAAAVVLGVLLVADLRVQRPALGLSLRGR